MGRRSVKTFAVLLSIAAVLPACGDEEGEEGGAAVEIVSARVAEILANPQEFDRVRVNGTGAPVGSAGFVISDDGPEILVYSRQLPALRVDDGDELTVVGRVDELERHQIERVIDEVEQAGGRRGTIDADALANVPLLPGDPYLELINVRDEGGNQDRSRARKR